MSFVINMCDFTHLHLHSEFSFHAGIAPIDNLVKKAVALGMSSLALTDTDRMSGLVLFYKSCLEHNIKPILGVELTNPHAPSEYVVLLAKNNQGYGDLCELTTKRHLEEKSFSFERVFSVFFPNLFLLTHTPGLLRMLSHTPNGQNLYGELINWDKKSRARSREIETVAHKLDMPLVAANNVHFIEKNDWQTHKILRAIGLGSVLSRLGEEEYVPEKACFRSQDEMRGLFPNHAEALLNTQRIAGQCKADLALGTWILPRIQVPDGQSPEAYLSQAAYNGLEAHYGATPEYSRAKTVQDKELAVINKLGYASYFLMVKQIRDWANNRLAHGYRRPVDCTLMRGSAANSITFYNIGASDLDPIKYNLYFERFLNEERADPPDADLDFGWDERDAAFDYFTQTWGVDHVAVMCTTNRMRNRAAFRETAKVFGLSEEQVSELFDSRDMPADDPDIRKIMYYAEKITGKPRFLGQHPGGIIVTNNPIWRHVACERSGGAKNRVITQIDMHSGTDDLGLIKFDILGNGSLSVLRDTLMHLWEQGHKDPCVWDNERVRTNPAVGRLIAKGLTRGIFYIESPAQIKLNRKAMAGTFEEIGITSSAVRPAGAASTKVFVERHRKQKQGITDWEYLHPALKPLLSETHDCLIYQEDVIKVCHEVAGLSFKRADRVRKMMNSMHYGKPGDYNAIACEFLGGCAEHSGLTQAQAMELWERVCSFSGFSFCKSHSLSYAQLSFKCAYLKAHFPAQFLAAVVSNNHGFYATSVYLNEARRFGIRIQQLDINKSDAGYVGRGQFMIPGLMHIKGLGHATMRQCAEERKTNGRYANLIDFLLRTRAGLKETELLIKTGCFDGFNMNHPELLSLLHAEYGKIRRESRGLFDYAQNFRDEFHPGLADYSFTRRCLNELEILGFMLSGNILSILDLHPASKTAVPAADIYRYVGRRVKLLGWPITARPHHIPGRGEMKFITVEDNSGCADIVLWPEAYAKYEHVTHAPGPYEIFGSVREEWDTYSVIVEKMGVVTWSPVQIDFERAACRLRDSYRNFAHEPIASQTVVAA